MNWLTRFFSRSARVRTGIAAMHIAPERLADIRESDQFIVSFPRSGNTWTRHLVHELILQRKPDSPPPAELEMLLPTMHKGAMDHPAMAEYELKTRIIKSHNIRDVAGRRMIYLFRMPADSLVSLFHYRQRLAEKRGETFEQQLDAFCDHLVPSWCEHLELGLRQATRHPDRTLLLAYETLHTGTAAAFRSVADFLGLDATAEQIALAVERASFGQLRAREEKGVESDGGKSSYFYRKGRVGSATEELSPETLRAIESRALPLYQRALAASLRRETL